MGRSLSFWSRQENYAASMINKPIDLLLPWPPSVNHYWGQSGNRRFIGKKGIEFRKRVLQECVDISPIEGRLAVHVSLFPPDKRKRDIDNILKSLLDACEHAGCYASDSQIDELHIVRLENRKEGGCSILILPI
jgi:crossover junction endodeoxyribonuclease RusA